jgi:hypothetical protein
MILRYELLVERENNKVGSEEKQTGRTNDRDRQRTVRRDC